MDSDNKEEPSFDAKDKMNDKMDDGNNYNDTNKNINDVRDTATVLSLDSSPGFLVFWPFRTNLVEERDQPSGSAAIL